MTTIIQDMRYRLSYFHFLTILKNFKNFFKKMLTIYCKLYIITKVIYLPVWRNWQTHRTQNPAVAIPYRFDPDHRHLLSAEEFLFFRVFVFLQNEKSCRKKFF